MDFVAEVTNYQWTQVTPALEAAHLLAFLFLSLLLYLPPMSSLSLPFSVFLPFSSPSPSTLSNQIIAFPSLFLPISSFLLVSLTFQPHHLPHAMRLSLLSLFLFPPLSSSCLNPAYASFSFFSSPYLILFSSYHFLSTNLSPLLPYFVFPSVHLSLLFLYFLLSTQLSLHSSLFSLCRPLFFSHLFLFSSLCLNQFSPSLFPLPDIRNRVWRPSDKI
ncbi:unnamed protein product [Acanthosepion pharaonis]|uniref:Uncharacterized protein n=1 Tax=Acanthosepion pharaonis TaxID=158019 RepID=A0A812D6U0_ACAPH|nr:unnamed protein product [Sepia pharaonis]